ncbi:MAG: S1 RNA-binding domain-containing protein [Acidimicrobiia bacterium]
MEAEETQLAVWRLFLERTRWRSALDQSTDVDSRKQAEEMLATLPDVSALDALRANAELISRLSAQRWIAMQVARDEGANMEELGRQLGVSRQAAWEFLKRKIDEHGGDMDIVESHVNEGADHWAALSEKIEASESIVDPVEWEKFSARYDEGDTVSGVVTRTMPFGAFISLGETVAGFMPRSSVPALPAVGDEVTAKVDRIDVERRRVSLTL